MSVKRVLISVKTYPNLSRKYEEVVCTAGFLEDGSWIRIYPIPFRNLDYTHQYRKYDWLEIDLVKNTKDFRPESFRPANIERPGEIVGHWGTKKNWAARKTIALKNVYTNLSKLIDEAKNPDVRTSLATFKPTDLIDFIIVEEKAKHWDKNKLEIGKQFNLFGSKKRKEVLLKLPYKFYYRFKDDEKRESKMMIEDWEIGALFWNCLGENEGDEKAACEKVKQKYWEDFAHTKDLYFYLGTTFQHHNVAPNPFLIIGTFHPQMETQLSLNF